MKQLAVGVIMGVVATAAVQAIPARSTDTAPQATTTAGGARACSRAEEARNKAVVLALKPRTPEFYAAMKDDYVQHVPDYSRFAALNGVSDVEAVKLIDRYGLGATGRRLAPPPPGSAQPRDNFNYKVLAECDFVVAVGEHWHPEPGMPGKFYATYFFNMWRLSDGKLAEHWDPDDLPSPLPEYLRVPLKDMRPTPTEQKR